MPYLGTSTGSDAVVQSAIMADHLHPPVEVARSTSATRARRGSGPPTSKPTVSIGGVRWLPKGTDLNIGPVRLAIIEDHLNTMPRKLHDWHSAHSVYTELTCNHR